MPRRPGQALRIGVCGAGVAVLKTSRWPRAASLVAEQRMAAGEGATSAGIATLLRMLLADADCARWPVTFVVGDDLSRLWQVTPPPDCARLADLEAAAALRFQSLYGESAAGWQLSASWNTRAPFLAAALGRPLLDVLSQAALEHRLRVVEIVPQFVAGWNQWRGAVGPGAWYGLVHDGVLSFGLPDGAGIAMVRAAAVPDSADAAWLAEHVAREALRLNIDMPATLQLSGQVPQGWSEGKGSMACTILGQARDPGWQSPAWLAATGSAA